MTNINTLKAVIDHFELSHMWVPVDVDRLLMNDYPTAHIDYALAIVQANFKAAIANIERIEMEKYPDQKPDVPRYLQERALIYARVNAISYLLHQAPNLVERSTAWMLDEAQRTAWFRSDYLQWDTIEDMLAGIADSQEEGTGSYWQWKTFVTEIVPALKAQGEDPGVLMMASGHVRKVRGMVPAWNDLKERMANGQVTPQQGQELLSNWVDQAADPQVTFSTFKENVDSWRGNVVGKRKELDGWIIPIPATNGKRWMILEIGDDTAERMIAQALHNRVKFTWVRFNLFLEKLTQTIKLQRILKIRDLKTEGHKSPNGLERVEE